VGFELMFLQALEAGIRAFHACNTLPVPAGGLSGQPLKPVALQCIRRLRELCPADVWPDVRILGGGGVRTVEDVDDYADHGVHAVGVGTKLMNPIYLATSRPLEPLRRRAEVRLTGRPAFVVGCGAASPGRRTAPAGTTA
jgi:dihydroorotate dehydrogenase